MISISRSRNITCTIRNYSQTITTGTAAVVNVGYCIPTNNRWWTSSSSSSSSSFIPSGSSRNSRIPVQVVHKNVVGLPITIIQQQRQQQQRRPFFASSTDHTTLLQNSEVHCLEGGQGGGGTGSTVDSRNEQQQQQRQYVLVAQGTELDLVQKVPQLHLARIQLDTLTNTIYGAKVVNRTLGNISKVCSGRLLDAAFKDATTTTTTPIQARATLNGLSEWVLQQYSGKDTTTTTTTTTDQKEKEEEEKNVLLLQTMASASAATTTSSRKQQQQDDEYNEQLWSKVAIEFIQERLSDESNLYIDNGGILSHIEHYCDNTSDYASSSGGAMAIFTFSSSPTN